MYFTEFAEAAKFRSDDDSVSRHRLAPFNGYYLTYSQLFTPVSLSATTES